MWPKFSVRFLGVVSLLQVTFQVGSFTAVDMKKMSKKEREAIALLKRRVKRLKVPRGYMTEDYYLARWLQVRDYEVEATFAAFRKTLEWREKERVDGILKEDWSDMREKFPYTRNTTDKEGRPIIYIDISKWDVGGYLAEGGKPAQERFLRYLVLWGEEGDAHVKRLRDQGKQVTQVTMLINLEGFGSFQHAGLSCLQLYLEASLLFHPHYPNWRYKLVTVNSPPIFQAAYYLSNGPSRKDFLVYGRDRHHWEPKLLESVPLREIPPELRRK